MWAFLGIMFVLFAENLTWGKMILATLVTYSMVIKYQYIEHRTQLETSEIFSRNTIYDNNTVYDNSIKQHIR